MLQTIIQILALIFLKPIQKPVKLKKKILVLDLDETLVHASLHSTTHDFVVEVVQERSIMYCVSKRPFLNEFLEKVGQWYHVIIFTASISEYADPVLDYINFNFSKRYFRDSCTPLNGSFTKDLTLISTDLSNIILIDNSPICFEKQPENCILIDSWIDDPTDTALLELIPFLDSLRFVSDVRNILSLRK